MQGCLIQPGLSLNEQRACPARPCPHNAAHPSCSVALLLPFNCKEGKLACLLPLVCPGLCLSCLTGRLKNLQLKSVNSADICTALHLQKAQTHDHQPCTPSAVHLLPIRHSPTVADTCCCPAPGGCQGGHPPHLAHYKRPVPASPRGQQAGTGDLTCAVW